MTLPRGAKKPLHRHDWIMHHLKNNTLLLYPSPIPFSVDSNGNAYYIADGKRKYELSINAGAYIGAEGGYGLPIPEAMEVLSVASDTYHTDKQHGKTKRPAGKHRAKRPASKTRKQSRWW